MILYRDFLCNLKEGTALVVDTCTAMHPDFETFMEVIENGYKAKFKIVIPIDVYLETSKVSVEGKTEEARMKAQKALTNFHRGFLSHSLQLMREYSTGAFYADPAVIGTALSLSSQSDVIVMTQDCPLSRDIRSLSQIQTIKGGTMDAYKLASRGGGVYRFRDLSQSENNNASMVQLISDGGNSAQISYLQKNA